MAKSSSAAKARERRLSEIQGRAEDGADWAALLLGLGLGITIALQATTITNNDLSSFYSVVTSLSRLFALVGTYFALILVLLVARIPWVERSVGHDRLITWHRKFGPYSILLIGLHVLLVTLGFGGQDHVRLGVEMWRILNQYSWMWAALAGFVAMMAAGVSSYKKARARMSYETWWKIHVLMYVAIAVSFMHQVLDGAMFIDHPLNRKYWTALYIFVGFSVIFWRVGIPIARSIRHNLKVSKVVVEGPGIISVIMRGRKLTRLAAEGGQFFGWRFLAKNHLLISHPYSLSAAPTEHLMRITVKDLGDHSGSLAYLKPGTRVFVEGPYGAFTAGRSSRHHVVLVGGGVGITPIRAIMEEFGTGVQMDVVFRASREEDIVFRAELDYLAAKSQGTIRIHYLIGPRAHHPMDAEHLNRMIPLFSESDIYICGPATLVESVRKAATDSGIPKTRFHDEAFAFHAE
ncbi:MAG: ferredoxin reductase family protein [Actinobacteria bacterium]|nr:ferredoxin reductase family protein [Actinomycetota bacterium]